MKRAEVTSKKVAAIAGRVLEQLGGSVYEGMAPVYAMNKNSDLFLLGTSGKDRHVTVADLRALAASALTQAPDRKKRRAS